MNKSEAEAVKLRMANDPRYHAQIVRILPADIDPPKPDDNGWDVVVQIAYEDRPS